MKRLCPIALACLVISSWIAPASRAELIAYDGFDYAPGDLRGENGGAGDWTAPWTAGSGFGDGFSWQVAAPSLSYTDTGGRTLAATGGAIHADSGEHRETRPWDTAGHKDDGDVIWFSFLFNRGAGASTGHQIYIVGNGNLGTGIGIFIGATSIAARIDTDNDGHTSFSQDEDHFVVGRITFSDLDEDEVRFWLDPELDEAPLDTAANSSAVSAAVDQTSWNNLYLRKFGSGDDALDEFRIGTDFASVVPEPATAAAALFIALGAMSRRRHF